MQKQQGILFILTVILAIVFLVNCPQNSINKEQGNATYTIRYDKNGAGSGQAPGDQNKERGVNISIAPNSGNLVRAGWHFTGWNTQADGEGTSYHVGDSYSKDEPLALYAEWAAVVRYETNGADSGSVPEFQIKEAEKPIIIAGNTGKLIKSGRGFGGWNTRSDGKGLRYYANDIYRKNAPLTLYAEWTKTHIRYKANGASSGTAPVAQGQRVTGQSTIANNEDLLKTGRIFTGWNSQADGKGQHYEEGDPYIDYSLLTLYAEWGIPISTVSDFQKIRTQLAKSFVLLNDLDLPYSFEPIGTKDTPFTGTFYGEGHTLSNLYLIDTTAENLGFFRALKDAHVSDLVFNNPQVEGEESVGILAGTVSGSTIVRKVIIIGAHVCATGSNAGLLGGDIQGDQNNPALIFDCVVTGTVEGGGNNIGGMIGIIGRMTEGYGSSEVQHCIAEVHISATRYDSENIGGLVGKQKTGIINNSYATGKVSGFQNIGGLVGWNGGDITDSYATGKVSATGASSKYIGGLVGLQGSGTITDSYATGKVSAPGTNNDSIGGLVGYQKEGGITGSHATGEVSATGASSKYIGGLVGLQERGDITDSYATGKVNTTGIWSSNIGGLVGSQGDTISDSYAMGEVSARGDRSDSIGGLVGLQGSGTLTGSHATGKVSATGDHSDSIGGLVGLQGSGTITDTYATGKVSAPGTNSDSIGGLVGYQKEGGITGSYATGEVSAAGTSRSYVGGLVGYQEYKGTITDSYATGKVSGIRDGVGGLVGKQWGDIINSYATGAVSATGSSSGDIGGLVGQQRGTITDSYATGAVSATGDYSSRIGGLVGGQWDGAIAKSYATGAVSATGDYSSCIGGLVGGQWGGVITKSYAIGAISAGSSSEDIGGLVGQQGRVDDFLKTYSGNIIQSYFDPISTGQRQGIGRVVAGTGTPTGYNTSDLTGTSVLQGWDFTDEWYWLGRGQWPILQWQHEYNKQIALHWHRQEFSETNRMGLQVKFNVIALHWHRQESSETVRNMRFPIE
ncbi:hypothetical protein LSH36_793g00004 [Paralvinella palmiformis]|uniref:GLUG domain-containing protein n=1 Tax=Paralvinella palmiformis TaxID=53620 RepID=A0AAD9J1P2_9ANNE|nr:hypothetical protein LSH36_793g00004 [Paralvinella palmiformis]